MLIARRILAAIAVLPLSFLSAQEIRVTRGAVDQQVFQRNAEGFSNVLLTGSATGRKTNGKMVQVRVSSKTGLVPGFDWLPLAKIKKSAWSGELQRLPTGGPYQVDVRIEGTAAMFSVHHLLVGDLWILAGQSNMEGVGNLIDVQPPSEMVHSFDMADNWIVAKEPLHTLVNAADPIHWPPNADRQPERLSGEQLQRYLAQRKKGAGLGLPFAEDMVKRTGVPIGLIPCSHGGTSMDQWSPSLKAEEGYSLYGAMVRRFHAVGGNIKGVLWYQGESDAKAKSASEFGEKFVAFVKAVRSDFGEPNLPFYYVQIGRNISNRDVAEWNMVQDAQRKDEALIPNSGMVASIDLALDDSIHINTQDLKRLGKRLSNRACHDLFGSISDCGQLKPGPHPVSASFEGGVVKVRFSGVNGGLQADGRISGFTIHDASGLPAPVIYRAVIDPAEASTVRLLITGQLPSQASLYYGYGKDPYCNLRDAEDMAAPVFGPMPIQ
jgi:sialate O-acetylesterase